MLTLAERILAKLGAAPSFDMYCSGCLNRLFAFAITKARLVGGLGTSTRTQLERLPGLSRLLE